MYYSFLKALFSNAFFKLYEGEAGGGGGAGSGDAGAAGAAGDGAAGAGGAGAGGDGAAGAGATGSLLDGVQDAGLKEWAQAKGWQNVESVLKSSRNLEKMVGAPPEELIRIPINPDETTIRNVHTRLGMPESADKYDLPGLEGHAADESYLKSAREVFHKAGLSANQAKILNEWNNEMVKTTMEGRGAEQAANLATAKANLEREWGSGFERQMGIAAGAAQQLGFNETMINALEDSMGYDGVMKFMAGLGVKLGEDNFVGGEGGEGGRFSGEFTPAQAKAEYTKMIMDVETKKALLDRAHPQHKELLAKKQQLFKLAYPGVQQGV